MSDDETVAKQREKLAKMSSDNAENNTSIAAEKPAIEFEDFSKMDIRTGTILSAEKMPKTKKLMVLEVDTGIDKRTIVSGIAAHFEATEIIGQKVLVLVNLKPRKLRGVESNGMILMSENSEGKLCFVQGMGKIPNGHQVS